MRLIRKTAVNAYFNQFIEVCLSQLVQGTLELDNPGELLGCETNLRNKIALKGAFSYMQLLR